MRRPAIRPVVTGAVLVALVACGDEPTGPRLPELEIVATAGQGAFGTPGQALGFAAVVRRTLDDAPEDGVAVTWAVESGDASLEPGFSTESDAAGAVRATLRLGAVAGPVGLRVTVRDQPSATLLIEATLADRPELTGLAPTTAAAGGTVTIDGRGFSPVAGQNVVLFSGIRGRALSVTPERLEVEVPPCLPDRVVDVRVLLGELASEALPLSVTETGTPLVIAAGGTYDVPDPTGPGCLRLGDEAGARYLIVGGSRGTVGGGRYDYTLRGLVATPSTGAALRRPVGEPVRGPGAAADARSAAVRWEDALRAREAAAVAARRPGVPRLPRRLRPALRAPASVPSLGDTRTFSVLNADNGFDQVEAVVRHVGTQSVVYVDTTAPEGGYSDQDLADYALMFDTMIHPTVTGTFGSVTDLDDNGRVAILFTPTVNRLTPRGSGGGFVGGFFFGLDLLPEREGSNGGEVFYSLVPDPAGAFSDPRSRTQLLDVTPAVLAHEFQHMVHFGERILEREAEGPEALWLSEGLAQMAEELVARAFEAAFEPGSAERFRRGNRVRARTFLADPSDVSLVIATGTGSLAERGAGSLYVLYLWDRFGDDVLERLTKTTRTGVENVTTVAGRAWAPLLADWWSALYVERLGEPDAAAYDFAYPTVRLDAWLRDGPTPYPLVVPVRGAADFSEGGKLWSSSPEHYIVDPPPGGSVVLRLGGGGESVAPSGSDLGLRVVRLF